MEQKTLKQMILNELNNNERGYAEKLAEITGYSSGSALKKVLRDEKKEFEKFHGLLKLVETLFPLESTNLLSKYALTLDPNKQTARCMLEYTELHKLQDIRTTLVNSMLNCSNSTSKQWASIHNIDIKFTSGEINYLEALSLYEQITVKTPELEVLKKIYKSYCFLDEQMYGSVIDLMSIIAYDLSEVREEFIKKIIKGRHYLLLTESYTRKGSIEMARQFANRMIKDVECPFYESWGYMHLGNTYILEDFDKANENLVKAQAVSLLMPDNIKTNIKRSINFLDNVWKKQPREINLKSNHPADVHEVVFYYINHGQTSKAKELLLDKGTDELSFNQLGFHFYLKGLLTKSMADFCKSIKYFKLSGDNHFSKLPLIELKKMNIENCIIEALAV